MAALSKARAAACALPAPWLHLLLGFVIASPLARNIDASRLDGGAISSDESLVAGLAWRASVPLANDTAAARVQRDRDLRTAADYIDFVDVQDRLHLGKVKDILERFETIRERVTSFGAARDPRHRPQIRRILRKVKERGDALQVLARKLEAEGEVDDGGDKLPTQRDNICRRIHKYHVDLDFLRHVQLLCQYLDMFRKAVDAGEDEEPLAYSVSGLFIVMATKPDYKRGHTGCEIELVLNEERRWAAKHLASPPAGADNSSPSPEGTQARFRRWDLRAWDTEIWLDVEADEAARPIKAMKMARGTLATATVEDNLTLSSVRTRIERLEYRKLGLAQFISGSGPAFREGIREVLQEIRARVSSLSALAARKVEAGEVDNSGEMLPSQRDNICTKLEASGLEEYFREDVRKLCEAFDRMHFIAKSEVEREKSVFEVLGRMAAIGRRPGYSDTSIASELDNLFAEECSWLAEQETVVGA